MRLWPKSLATRTLLTLLLGLALVQGLGLTIHALDRIELQKLGAERDLGVRIMSAYRAMVATSIAERPAVLRELDLGPGATAALVDNPPFSLDLATPHPLQQAIRLNMGMVAVRPANRPSEVLMSGVPWDGALDVALRFPDHGWLALHLPVPPPRPWHSPTFLLAFLLMTGAAALLSLWAVRRLMAPVATLAAAAARLGRDVNAPPLPETGPSETARAAVAFNTMAERIRRFVADRTFLLTAIGHDLRTPITRLKLRAEFIDDEEQRSKLLADLDELDSMLASALAFGRDTHDQEPAVPLDLGMLLRTVLDETADARPEMSDNLRYEGPDHLTLAGRPLSLKRAFANLIGNAVKYGGSAAVHVSVPAGGQVRVAVEDEGPGLPAEETERVFEPFYRLERSRNRETGGSGLGLSIARNIFRAHGGDVVLGNRPAGGARALVTLPA